MQPTQPKPETSPHWSAGTDLRNQDGIYQWPHSALLQEGEEPTYYPSVTTVLDEYFGSGMRHAEHWFTAEYVRDLAIAARDKTPVRVWLETDNVDGGEMVEVKALDILLNRLPEEQYGKNFGMHWMKKAGPREMRKRANRGSVIHQALEDWTLGLRIDSDDIGDYTGQVIQGRGFALPLEFCEPRVRQLLIWLENNVEEVLMSETVVGNDTYRYAGTADAAVKLYKGLYPPLDDIGRIGGIDAKASVSDQPAHELSWFANLYVTDDGCKLRYWPRIKRCADPQDCEPFLAFLHARVLWSSMYGPQHPKTVKRMAVRLPERDFGLPAKIEDKLSQGALL
jgi:hypothetical protein